MCKFKMTLSNKLIGFTLFISLIFFITDLILICINTIINQYVQVYFLKLTTEILYCAFQSYIICVSRYDEDFEFSRISLSTSLFIILLLTINLSIFGFVFDGVEMKNEVLFAYTIISLFSSVILHTIIVFKTCKKE
jgi:hypothetical protein